jgi:hypothetical protein
MNNHDEVCLISRAIIGDLINVNETENGARFRLERHNMGQSTVIGNTYSRINKIESSMVPIFRRLRSCDFRTQLKNSSDCSLQVAYNIHYV